MVSKAKNEGSSNQMVVGKSMEHRYKQKAVVMTTVGSSRVEHQFKHQFHASNWKLQNFWQNFNWYRRSSIRMYGDLGTKLIQDAKRTTNMDSLPFYQEEMVRAITRETRELNRQAEAVITQYENDLMPSQDRTTSCSLFVQHLCMRRNKRCLLGYEMVRAKKMMEMVWNDMDLLDQDISNNLSPHEQDYARKYAELIVSYKGEWTDVDLTGFMEPPKDLFIDVRVLKDAGEIQAEYGVFNLTKDSQFFVRQGDVQRLIQQGYLQKL